jgi:electron transfer flavoprotein alpha subunit
MAVKIETSCIGCNACVPACKFDALTLGDDSLMKVDPARCIECGKCIRVCPVKAISFPPGSKAGLVYAKKLEREEQEKIRTSETAPAPAVQPANESAYDGGVWVYIEHREGTIAAVSLELLSAARMLADKLGVQVGAMLLGDKIDALVPTLSAFGADTVYVADDPVFLHYRTGPVQEGVCHLVNKYRPEIILMGATTTGRDLAGAVATRLRTGLTADCMGLDIDKESRRLLMATRPAFGGNIMATILCAHSKPQMATIRPRVMKALRKEDRAPTTIVRETIAISASSIRTEVLRIVRDAQDAIKIEEAPIVVSGGMGLKDANGFKLLARLAETIGGTVAGSRAAVEAGFVPQKRQVGQTGATIAPRLYIAVGISGAVQHIVGMQNAETIIAINRDPGCQMMQLANYGIVGDILEILPLMTTSFEDALRGTVDR